MKGDLIKMRFTAEICRQQREMEKSISENEKVTQESREFAESISETIFKVPGCYREKFTIKASDPELQDRIFKRTVDLLKEAGFNVISVDLLNIEVCL